MTNYVTLNAGLIASLPLSKDIQILWPDLIIIPDRENLRRLVTVKVSLIKLKEVGEGVIHIPPPVLGLHHVLGEVHKHKSHNDIRGNPSTP